MDKLSNKDLADRLLRVADLLQRLENTTYTGDGVVCLKEAVKRLREPEWINIEHQLPPPHTHIWCCNRGGFPQFEGCICYGMHEPFFTYPRGDGNASNTAPSWIDVTHWRPLPENPK